MALRAVDPENDRELRDIQTELGEFHSRLNQHMQTLPVTLEAVRVLVGMIMDFAPGSELKSVVPQYRQGDWFDKVKNACCQLLWESIRGAVQWNAAFERFEGIHDIPLMTIHKSKGLEFHTVIFVGLDDGQFWNMHKDQEEGLLTFFVAFSRAKDRAYFTYSHNRQRRQKVKIIYDLLQQAGVSRTDCETGTRISG